MTVTVPAPITRHLFAYLAAAVVAVALLVSVIAGFAIADSDSGPAVRDTGAGVSQETPSRFADGHIGSADALERRALDDPPGYGSADAAEASLR